MICFKLVIRPEGYRLRLLCYGFAYSLSLCCAYSSLTFTSQEDAAPAWRLATTALSAALAFLLLEERLGLSDGSSEYSYWYRSGWGGKKVVWNIAITMNFPVHVPWNAAQVVFSCINRPRL